MNSMINRIVIILMIGIVAGCGGGGAFTQASSTTGAGGGTTTSMAASVSLASTQTSVKSDNSNNATITATVLDADKAAVSGVVVAFSASGGQLSAASATTDALGQASVVFSSGSADPTNRTATVTATPAGLTPVQIPIIVSGSTLAITVGQAILAYWRIRRYRSGDADDNGKERCRHRGLQYAGDDECGWFRHKPRGGHLDADVRINRCQWSDQCYLDGDQSRHCNRDGRWSGC